MGNQRSNDTRINHGVWAELVSEKEKLSNAKPVKVLINEGLATTAVDSLKDSEQVLQILAKNILMDMLRDKSTGSKFGNVLSQAFDSEAVLYPTRELVFWSLQSKECKRNIRIQSRWQMTWWMRESGHFAVKPIAVGWLRHPDSQKLTVTPLLTWTLEQRDYTHDPLMETVAYNIPFAKEAAKNSLRCVITEQLKSDEVKSVVKDALLQRLARFAKSSPPTANSEIGTVQKSDR